MNPVRKIMEAEAQDGPIQSIRVAAVRRPHTPVRMVITWSEFVSIRDNRKDSDGVKASGVQRRRDTGRIITTPWECWEDIEEWILDAAWWSGAWDCRRLIYGPSGSADPYAPGAGLTNTFGGGVYEEMEIVGDSSEQMITEAYETGYCTWLFKPTWSKDRPQSKEIFDCWLKNDSTLRKDGTREGVHSFKNRPAFSTPQEGEASDTVFTLGKNK